MKYIMPLPLVSLGDGGPVGSPFPALFAVAPILYSSRTDECTQKIEMTGEAASMLKRLEQTKFVNHHVDQQKMNVASWYRLVLYLASRLETALPIGKIPRTWRRAILVVLFLGPYVFAYGNHVSDHV